MTKRSSIEILEDFKAFLDRKGDYPFFKSDLKKINLFGSSVDKLIAEILFIQQELPLLELLFVDNKTIIKQHPRLPTKIVEE